MNYSPVKSILIIFIVTLTSVAIQAQAEQLNIQSYGGSDAEAYRNAYWTPFEKKTGIKINESVAVSNLGKIRAQVASGFIQWDIAQVLFTDRALGCRQGYFVKMDQSKLPTGDLLPGTTSKCGVVSEFAGTLIAYNTKALTNGPETWADFWNTKKFPGNRCMQKRPENNLEFALLADGVAKDDIYEVLKTKKGRNRAFKKLDELKSHIVWWTSGTEQIQELITGECDIGTVWNGRVASANENGQQLKMVWKAGYILGGNDWVILKGSPHVDEAMKFIKFALAPKRQANFMETIPYSTANAKAYKLISQDLKDVLPATKRHLDYAIRPSVEFWTVYVDSVDRRFNNWLSQ